MDRNLAEVAAPQRSRGQQVVQETSGVPAGYSVTLGSTPYSPLVSQPRKNDSSPEAGSLPAT